MEKTTTVTVWRDIHIKKYIYIAICLGMFITFTFLGHNNLLNPEISLDYFSLILILIFSGVLLINILRIKLSAIYVSGIRIGNAPDNSYEKFRLKQKPLLILWGNIKEIKIYGKDVSTALAPGIINLIRIKLNTGQIYECFIAQPKGFVKTLKDLNKHHLLTKDSKYREILK